MDIVLPTTSTLPSDFPLDLTFSRLTEGWVHGGSATWDVVLVVVCSSESLVDSSIGRPLWSTLSSYLYFTETSLIVFHVVKSNFTVFRRLVAIMA
jgi:hypothetical protein